ncbi:hypothetical protein CAPTEDRAFT_213500 [Capitella teleta]|uniref:C-type lectin domain-containing protein n=1 Tax=Capitella teleta TaxID=283909 RepID=R7UEL3_CAPTE|nr:hypothetical protein CAPTEDRAFT_213500 [Capitella teleta]|eukprot:ELU04521.1 hypothetical protein CAPTEDRAFT_213500 [Capitella teleta]
MGRFGKQNAGGVICACATGFGDWNSERKHPAKEERSRKMIQWRRLLNLYDSTRWGKKDAGPADFITRSQIAFGVMVGCQSSWQTANGATKSCYTLSEVKMSWNDAKADCENGTWLHLKPKKNRSSSSTLLIKKISYLCGWERTNRVANGGGKAWVLLWTPLFLFGDLKHLLALGTVHNFSLEICMTVIAILILC